MDKQTYILVSGRIRQNAILAIQNAPDDYTVTIAPKKRSGDQNALLWALLTDVSRTKPEGRQWTPETWKAAFMHSLGHQVRFCEGLDGSGPFPIGFRTSNLNVKQMSDLITVITEYGDRHGVKWTHDKYGLEAA